MCQTALVLLLKKINQASAEPIPLCRPKPVEQHLRANASLLPRRNIRVSAN